MLQTVIAERGIAMFRLANYGDDEVNELYKYLSTTASKVIWNGLDQWAGSVEKILDLYMMEFAGPSVGIMDQDFFDQGVQQFSGQFGWLIRSITTRSTCLRSIFLPGCWRAMILMHLRTVVIHM